MFTEDQIKSGINTIDRQLLYDIRELLTEQSKLLQRLVSDENEQGDTTVPDDYKTPAEGQQRRRGRQKRT